MRSRSAAAFASISPSSWSSPRVGREDKSNPTQLVGRPIIEPRALTGHLNLAQLHRVVRARLRPRQMPFGAAVRPQLRIKLSELPYGDSLFKVTVDGDRRRHRQHRPPESSAENLD